MTMDRRDDGLNSGGESDPRPASILPPHRVMQDWLDETSVETLLRLALSREAAFVPTKVGADKARAFKPEYRTSLALRSLPELAAIFNARLRQLAPSLVAEMRLSAFDVRRVELELVAHGDGAFYKRHIDVRTGGDLKFQRVLSGVYYFNHQPKAFSGGALRLYAIGNSERFFDIEPVHNTFVAFPSWAPHEVMPVSCPSGAFVDSRFAVNCWMHRQAPPAAIEPSDA